MKQIPLTTNVPIAVALRTIQGVDVRTRYKGIQRMFQDMDGRPILVSQMEGHQIETRLAELGIRAGERILLYKEQVYGVGRILTTRVNVYRAGLRIGQQTDGTFIVPKTPGAAEGLR